LLPGHSPSQLSELIRIDDPDEPVYRIFPLWCLEEALRLRQLVLVSPRMWEDPFEVVGDAIAVDRPNGDRLEQVIINQSLPPAYAQCWSATQESDTLLRAYSRVVKDTRFRRNTCPRDEGVRVRSTPRKLFEAMLVGTDPGPKVDCFVGSVQYLRQEALLQEIANAVGSFGLNVFGHPANRAKLLLMKRMAFAHEAEVRLIVVYRQQTSSERTFPIRIDPNSVFDEIAFDPRLERFERMEREAAFKSLGFTGRFGESQLYMGALLQIRLGAPPTAG
jgi:hypothetical protein